MSGPPLVSCIVAAYNYAGFLPSALDSALAQDYEGPLEVVVVDDGSTDATPEVVRPYLHQVRYIRKENGGVISAVNRGAAEARGDFLAFLSADDLWPPDKVRRQVEHLLARPEVGLLYTDMEVIDEEGHVVEPSFWRAQRITPRRGRVLSSLLGSNFVSGGGIMLRADLAPRVYPIPEVGAWEDWWTALQVARVAELDFLPAPLYRYRLHGANMNLGADRATQIEIARSEQRFRRWLLAELDDPQLSLTDYLALYYVFSNGASGLGAVTGDPWGGLGLAPDAEARAEAAHAEAIRLARLGRGEEAVRELLRTVGHLPWHEAATRDLRPLLERVHAAAQAQAQRRPVAAAL